MKAGLFLSLAIVAAAPGKAPEPCATDPRFSPAPVQPKPENDWQLRRRTGRLAALAVNDNRPDPTEWR